MTGANRYFFLSLSCTESVTTTQIHQKCETAISNTADEVQNVCPFVSETR